MKFLRYVFCLLALMATASATARADNYPDKSVTILVPYSPGGATDIMARVIAASLSKMYGQNFLVVNKVGAFGILAMQELIRNDPDGYFFMIGNVSTNGITPILYKDRMNFDYRKDITTITQLSLLPSLVLATEVNFKYKNLKDVLAYARANPGMLRYASPGLGTYPQFDTELMALRAGGLKLLHVPLKGGASDMLNSLATGDTQIGFVNMATAQGMVSAGKLYPLAAVYPTRLPQYPNVPTMAEEGFPGVGTVQWTGAFIRAGTPQPITDKLFNGIKETLNDPSVVATLAKSGIMISLSQSPAAAEQWQLAELAKWRKIAGEVHVSLN